MISLGGEVNLGTELSKRREPTVHQRIAARLHILQKRKLESEREQPQKNEAPELKLSVEECDRQIQELESKLDRFQQEKHKLFLKLKKVLHMEDERRRSAQKKITREREREAKPLATPMENTVVDGTASETTVLSPDRALDNQPKPTGWHGGFLESSGGATPMKRPRSPSPVQLYPPAPPAKRPPRDAAPHAYPTLVHQLQQHQPMQEQSPYVTNPHLTQLLETRRIPLPPQQQQQQRDPQLAPHQEHVHVAAQGPPLQQAIAQQPIVMVRHGGAVYEAAPGQAVLNPVVLMQPQPGQPHPEEIPMLQYGGSANMIPMMGARTVGYTEPRVHAEYRHEPPPDGQPVMIPNPGSHSRQVLSPPHRHHQGGLLPLPGTEETYDYREYGEADCEREEYYHEHVVEEMPSLQHRLTQMAKPSSYGRLRPLLGPNFQGRRNFIPRDMGHRGGGVARFGARMRTRGYGRGGRMGPGGVYY